MTPRRGAHPSRFNGHAGERRSISTVTPTRRQPPTPRAPAARRHPPPRAPPLRRATTVPGPECPGVWFLSSCPLLSTHRLLRSVPLLEKLYCNTLPLTTADVDQFISTNILTKLEVLNIPNMFNNYEKHHCMLDLKDKREFNNDRDVQ